ncbi:YfdX family protein [Roseibium sp. RKSG952]|uniref:YfdX family protein n=1 Tax=Roseibium sp. RKSG952 TaxID=2529384 RepID=UPI0018AD2DA6|nr:YfdX family protein [Roseibium sp. RKSG952]
MKANTKSVATIVALALATTSLSQIAFAETEVSSETETGGEVETQHIRIPATGKLILDGVRAARLALFDGNLDQAKEIVSASRGAIDEHAAKFSVHLSDSKGYALPVDSGLKFSDGFEPTDQHGASITQAGVMIQEGRVDEAIKVMSKAGVELDVAVVMLPVGATATHLEQALTDIEAGQIHKANMALKAVETSTVIQDFKPGNLPAQGYPLADILPG